MYKRQLQWGAETYHALHRVLRSRGLSGSVGDEGGLSLIHIYYLTDTIAVLHDAGYAVTTVVVPDPATALEVNDRAQLAVAEAELRKRINTRWMRRGVTMWDPERTYLDLSLIHI